MKKITLLLMLIVSLSVKAFDFSYSASFSIGSGYTYSSCKQLENHIPLHMGIEFYNFHANMFLTLKCDNEVGDQNMWGLNFAYTIPFTKWFRVGPLLGFQVHNIYTSRNTVYIDFDNPLFWNNLESYLSGKIGYLNDKHLKTTLTYGLQMTLLYKCLQFNIIGSNNYSGVSIGLNFCNF